MQRSIWRPAWLGSRRRPGLRAVGLAAVAVLALVAAACGGGGPNFDDPRLFDFDDEFTEPGQDHLPVGLTYPYNTTPPYAGPHWEVPSQCAIYEDDQPFEPLVHSMEHGVVILYFQPDLFRTEDVAAARRLGSEILRDGKRFIMTPSREIADPVVLAAWGHLLAMETFEEDTIRGFVDAFDGRGPEDLPADRACAGQLHVR